MSRVGQWGYYRAAVRLVNLILKVPVDSEALNAARTVSLRVVTVGGAGYSVEWSAPAPSDSPDDASEALYHDARSFRAF
jgi:hypothetical protein